MLERSWTCVTLNLNTQFTQCLWILRKDISQYLNTGSTFSINVIQLMLLIFFFPLKNLSMLKNKQLIQIVPHACFDEQISPFVIFFFLLLTQQQSHFRSISLESSSSLYEYNEYILKIVCNPNKSMEIVKSSNFLFICRFACWYSFCYECKEDNKLVIQA